MWNSPINFVYVFSNTFILRELEVGVMAFFLWKIYFLAFVSAYMIWPPCHFELRFVELVYVLSYFHSSE